MVRLQLVDLLPEEIFPELFADKLDDVERIRANKLVTKAQLFNHSKGIEIR